MVKVGYRLCKPSRGGFRTKNLGQKLNLGATTPKLAVPTKDTELFCCVCYKDICSLLQACSRGEGLGQLPPPSPFFYVPPNLTNTILRAIFLLVYA